jgi:hypothetical protein
MSSHHVVREKQEPALLVLGLDGFDDELLGQLLEWSPTVITTGKTAETIHAFGIKIDWIIADVALPELQEDVKLLPAGTDTFAEAALKYLITNSYPAVNVVTDDFQLKDFVFLSTRSTWSSSTAIKRYLLLNPVLVSGNLPGIISRSSRNRPTSGTRAWNRSKKTGSKPATTDFLPCNSTSPFFL